MNILDKKTQAELEDFYKDWNKTDAADNFFRFTIYTRFPEVGDNRSQLAWWKDAAIFLQKKYQFKTPTDEQMQIGRRLLEKNDSLVKHIKILPDLCTACSYESRLKNCNETIKSIWKTLEKLANELIPQGGIR